MATKRLPTLPFLPNVPSSVGSHYASQLNLAINSFYRNIVASVDGLFITATSSSQFPPAQGFKRFAFDGSQLYIDWNTTSWTPLAFTAPASFLTGVMTTTAGGATAGHTFNQALSKLEIVPGSNITVSATTAASAATITFIGNSGGGGAAFTCTYETPSGATDGTNRTFTIGNTPLEEGELYMNEAVLIPVIHYNRTAKTIVMVTGQAPDSGDVMNYRYRY